MVPAAQVNVPAAGHLEQAPPLAPGSNRPAAQVNVPAAGQLGQAPLGDVPWMGPAVPFHSCNESVHPQIVHD